MEVITLTKNYFGITFIFDAVICSINCSALFENLFSVSAITVIFMRVEYQWCSFSSKVVYKMI